MRIKHFIVCIFILTCVCLGFEAFASEPKFIREGIRARGMGKAFTAVANDESMLFYNPAGVAALEEGLFEAISIGAAVNKSLQEISNETDPAVIFDMLVGGKMFLEIDLAILSYLRPRFGYTIFYGALTDVEVHNPTIPVFDARSYIQQGIVFGYGYPTTPNLDLGYNLKFIKRTGMDQRIYMTEFTDISNIEQWFATRSKFAFDFGFMYHLNKDPKHYLRWGFMANNMGGLDFGEAGGNIPGTYDTGLSLESKTKYGMLIIALDIEDFTYENTEFQSQTRNTKFGVEFGVGEKLFNKHHFFEFRLGLNGTYPTLGFSLNLWGVKTDYARWGEEYGRYGGEKMDDRQALQISLLF